MFGLLNLDKPPGVTSRDVVNDVQRLVRPHKVGHAGTLDPLATGVLVIAVGAATRLVEYVQRMPKVYLATFLLGRTSHTDDVEGNVTELENAPRPSESDLLRMLPRFIGVIEQRPPAFSAIKVGGKRAYKLARAGEEVELPPRPVTIHSLELVEYAWPELVLTIRCGSGTYVRSLGRDLAESLGTAAVMSALVRTSIGPFAVDEATDPDLLTAENLAEHLQPALRSVSDLPRVQLGDDDLRRIAHGQSATINAPHAAAEVAALDAGGHLVALLVPDGRGAWRPHRNFPRPS